MKQYDMNDGATRRRVFWLLQRLTSYTLWQRKRDAWERFTRAYEDAIKTWPKSQPEQMEADHLPRIYDVLGFYNRGLEELAQGHRSVWRLGRPLYEAEQGSGTVQRNFYRHPQYWERGMQLEPWPPKVEALYQLLLASVCHGDQTPLEIDYGAAHLGARWSSPGALLNAEAYDDGFHKLPLPVFPDPLPELPPAKDVFIKSGDVVPVDGIWEPVNYRQERLFGIVPAGARSVDNNGCFNYLVGATQAPRITGGYDEAAGRSERVRTHWRLLWEDTRYTDGVIPDESAYFLAPKAVPEPAAGDAEMAVKTGEVCPRTGLWQAVDHDRAPVEVEAGTVMPDLLVPDQLGELRQHWVVWRLVKATRDV